MSSIFGIICTGHVNNELLQRKITAMSTAMRHRGPDKSEVVLFNNGAIGINCLAVMNTDIQKTICFNAGKYSVVSGRITNIQEPGLKGERGYDASMIPPLYEKHGKDFAKKLSGMFGIAVYDSIV